MRREFLWRWRRLAFLRVGGPLGGRGAVCNVFDGKRGPLIEVWRCLGCGFWWRLP